MLSIDPEVGAALAAIMGPNPPPKAPVGDIATRRATLAGLFNALAANLPQVTDVQSTDFYAKASDGHSILCRWYTKTASPSPGSAILYLHGGGMIALTIENYAAAIQSYVSATGVPFLLVNYRLAPEVRSPTPVTDAYAALQYLHSHAPSLGVDPTRIAIMGDSAGGGIAASLAHYAKHHHQQQEQQQQQQQSGSPPQIAKQILIYPMLDDRNTTPDPAIAPYATWSNDDNITGWTALLGAERIGGPEINVFEAAGRMTVQDAVGLPPAYIDVGELDIFREEDLEYARMLARAGVSCEFHLTPGACHAYEVFAPGSKVALNTLAQRIGAVLSV